LIIYFYYFSVSFLVHP